MSYLTAFRVVVESVEDACLLRVVGDIDANSAGDLRNHLRGACRSTNTVLVDLANVSFIDSTGLQVLLEESEVANELGSVIFVVRPSSIVRRLIDITDSSAHLAVIPPGRGLTLLQGHANG